MGEPAIPTDQQRADTLADARAIVEGVREEYGGLVFRLARDLVIATEERDNAEPNIAAWLLKQAEGMHPKIDRSAIKVLRALAADIRASRWPRAPRAPHFDRTPLLSLGFAISIAAGLAHAAEQARGLVIAWRPVVEAAKAWRLAGHTFDADCRSGDCDSCTQPYAEVVLSAAIATLIKAETP